jgi:hypothetical protein
VISNLSSRDQEAALFQIPDAARSAPVSWGVLVPAVFVINVALAIFAWFVVGWAMKTM